MSGIIICCECSCEFENIEGYRKHYYEQLRKGNRRHDNWFGLIE